MQAIILRAGLALALGTGAALADATQFEGRFALDPASGLCIEGEGDVAGAAFRIEDGVFYGPVSECRMLNPTNIRDMRAVLFDFDCTGEGARWQDRVLLMLLDDGSLLRVVDGLAFADPPCPE